MKKFNFLRSSLVVWAVVFFLITIPKVSFSVVCGETLVSSQADCTNALCKGFNEINPGPPAEGVCVNCCDSQTSTECDDYPGCHWQQVSLNWGQCQNEPGVSCDGVPEVPKQSRAWLLGAFLLAGFGFTAALRLRKKSVSRK